ncbi:MAG: ATP-binding cassette domain-containing protein [Dehalococcoidia bacterium]
MAEMLLEANNVKKYFPVTRGLLVMREVGWIKAVDGISFSVAKEETFGLVGESGCGKTTTSKLILLLEKLTAGSILFGGKDIQRLSLGELREYRGSVQAVFQDPYSSLSPRMRIKDIIAEPLVVNNTLPEAAIGERVREILNQVGIRADSADNFPHEFSGGQSPATQPGHPG